MNSFKLVRTENYAVCASSRSGTCPPVDLVSTHCADKLRMDKYICVHGSTVRIVTSEWVAI